MKTIGIVAHSAEGGALCFLTACREGAGRLGPFMHPTIVVSAVPMALSMESWRTGDHSEVTRHLTEGVRRVADAGADFWVCPDNTAHLVLERIAGNLPIPGLHIADVVEVAGQQRLVSTPLWRYLGILPVTGGAELAVFCAAMVGAGLSFLWFNTYPASVFMGDIGSLALGGGLGGLAVLSKNEVASAIIRGVFLAEARSVMIQVASFKMTGRRVFKMAPVHHHFELKGLSEPKIIVRFWIVSIVCGAVALMTLKLR